MMLENHPIERLYRKVEEQRGILWFAADRQQ
jgi:hypothetical protein